MDRVIYTAMTGASQVFSQQAAMAHNMANAATTGYRAEMHTFRAVPVQGPGLPTRAFVADASVMTNFTPGTLQQTGRTLDVAIQGEGLVALAMPDGSEAYTRNGSLELDANGVLQTRNGIPVQGDGGPITVPPNVNVTIGKDGTISVIPQAGAQNTVSTLGRIKLVNPPEHALVRGGDGLFRLQGGQPAEADAKVALASGYLEGSNVNVVEEMVSMISLARQFEMQMKVLSTAETNDRAASQILSLQQ